MHQTALRRLGATPDSGMRRILKKGIRPLDFIREAVRAKCYRDRAAEAEAAEENAKDGDKFKRRPDPHEIQEYPIHYEILEMNPPVPDPLKITRKEKHRLKKSQKPHPVNRLLQMYWSRLDRERRASEKMSMDEYYRHLLQIPYSPLNPRNSALGKKSSAMQKAYAFCMKQHQVMRTQGKSEEDALSIVNELLEQDDEKERKMSRAVRNQVVQARYEKDHGVQLDAEDTDHLLLGHIADDDEFGGNDSTESSKDNDDDDEFDMLDEESLPTVFTQKPMALEAMAVWSARLQAIPYREWTIGARTTLDHWVAKGVLNLSEETWQALLEGDSKSLRARGMDLLETRQALFPETIPYTQELLEERETENDIATTDQSIEELLATLGGFGDDDMDDDMDGGESDLSDWNNTYVSPKELDEKVKELVDQLQQWRAKQQESPYEQWDKEDKMEFSNWLQDYIDTLRNELDGEVDLEETRNALLADPPFYQDRSDEFWDAIRDESAVEEYVEKLAQQYADEEDLEDPSMVNFLRLPKKTQIERLMQLSTLRPVLDEYTPETKRTAWMLRYGQQFLQDVKAEHFVLDPADGTITGEQVMNVLGEDVEGIVKNGLYRVDMVPFGMLDEENNATVSKAQAGVRELWQRHKSGRAEYEERMFKHRILGVRYGDDRSNIHEENWDEELDRVLEEKAKKAGKGNKGKPKTF